MSTKKHNRQMIFSYFVSLHHNFVQPAADDKGMKKFIAVKLAIHRIFRYWRFIPTSNAKAMMHQKITHEPLASFERAFIIWLRGLEIDLDEPAYAVRLPVYSWASGRSKSSCFENKSKSIKMKHYARFCCDKSKTLLNFYSIRSYWQSFKWINF